MTDSPDKRQADLEWLYGRDASSAPAPRADQPAPARPRVASEPYDSSDLPPPRRPVAPTPRPERASPRPERQAAQPQQPGERLVPGQRPRRRRPRRAARLLRLLLLLLVGLLTWLIAVPVHAVGQMDKVDQSAGTDRPRRQPGTAVLLVGNDARPDTGQSDDGGQRADTIMLLYRPRSGQSVLVSLPRDSLVTIPGYGQDKLNAAYAFGGAALLTQTVEQATGIRIDGYLEVGFDSFAGLVDAVGGVEACPDFALTNPDTGLYIEPGCQLMDGQAALAYVRMRYEDPRGDIGRAERQREIIGKIVDKAVSPASVINPVRYWRLTHSVAGMITRGDETSILNLAAGGLALLDVAGGNGLSLVAPIADPAGWFEGTSVVIWDEAAAAQLFGEIAAGDTSQLARFSG